MEETKYWTLSETRLCQLFQVGQDGLSEAEVEKIRSKKGENVLQESPKLFGKCSLINLRTCL